MTDPHTATEPGPACPTCGADTEPAAGVWWCTGCGQVAREIDCCE